MKPRRVWKLLEVAASVAVSREDIRAFLLGAVGLRGDGAMVCSFNQTSVLPDRCSHAEYRLAKKLDRNSTVFVARVRRLDGQMALARPCPDCLKLLISKKVTRIYYTITPLEYGVIDLSR